MTFLSFTLPFDTPPVLAVGSWLKASVCAMHGRTALVSETIGDLIDADVCNALERAADQLCAERSIRPALVVHDLHPDFFSTRLAVQLAERQGIPVLPVQHHHAHVAAVCAEHGVIERVLGLAMDGVGLGSDGQAWGGELLRCDGADFQRLGHLFPLRLPGGDRAAREAWRMGASALAGIGRQDQIVERFADRPGAATIATMLERDVNCPSTSSLGRLFDAAAGLLGICPQQSFEGEAAMALEKLAERHGETAALTGGYGIARSLDFRPLLAALADGMEAGYGAALFHATVAEGLAAWVRDAVEQNGTRRVACGGGCFQNRLLVRRLSELLQQDRIEVLTAQRLSPGDAGLSLGQAWIGARHLQKLALCA